MLKTCFLPTFYPNCYNKTCGEIICQTETTFTIICKVCDIKLFDYDDFIKHFRNRHWPEVDNGGEENSIKRIDTKIKYKIYTKENDRKEILKPDNQSGKYVLQTSNEIHEKCVETDTEEVLNLNEDSGSDDSSKPLTILQKVAETSLETTKEQAFECIQCNRNFTTKFYLRFHIRQQHEPKNFECDKCNKCFVEKRYLTLHQRSHIGYTCQICHKVFNKYEALRYHGESHIQTRNFLCDYENCGKAFPNNRRLSAHKRSHFASPSFVCEICGSRQRSKEFLVVHIRTHTGEKPFACKKCDRRFASKHFLQDHQSVHATERSHICTVCAKTFASSKSLYHHRHLHSGIKKYVCKICNSAYSQAAGLSAHMRKHKQDYRTFDTEDTLVQP